MWTAQNWLYSRPNTCKQQWNYSCEAQHDGVWLSFRGVRAAAVSEVTGGWGSDPGGVVPAWHLPSQPDRDRPKSGHASTIHTAYHRKPQSRYVYIHYLKNALGFILVVENFSLNILSGFCYLCHSLDGAV